MLVFSLVCAALYTSSTVYARRMSKRRNYKRQTLAVLTGSAAPQKFETRRPAVLAHARSEEAVDVPRDAMKMSRPEEPAGEEDEPSYLENLKAAFLVNGGDTENTPTVGAWVGHVISLPWKVSAALLPPASLWGAYPLFVSSIVFISGVSPRLSCTPYFLVRLVSCARQPAPSCSRFRRLAVISELLQL